MKFFWLTAVAAVVLSGCAQFSNEIVPYHTSTSIYKNYSCNQLELEENRVSHELETFAAEQDKIANRDASLALGAVFVVTSPTVFFMTGGNGPLADEIANLRGELVAIQKVKIQKNC